MHLLHGTDMDINLLCVALEDELGDSEWWTEQGYTLVYTGVGKVQAAHRLVIAITSARLITTPTMPPNISIFNYGTAGSLRPDVSGLVEIGKFIQRDMNADPIAPRGTIPFSTIDSIKTQSPVSQITCGTGDSFVKEPDVWYTENKIDCVDMEGWALAYIAKEYNLPFRSFKYISDSANSNAEFDWKENCKKGEILIRKLLDAHTKL